MLRDLEKFEKDETVETDICIVGGGAVGLAMAAELTRKGRRVMLLESGGRGLEERAQDLLVGASKGHPFKNIGHGRYRVLGGSTTFWGGQVILFDPVVFEDRPWVSEARWPFGRDILDPYYQRAYDLLGLGDAELEDEPVWRGLKLPAPQLSEALEVVLTRWVRQRNLSRLFQRDIEETVGLDTIVHANVVGFATEGGRISAVEARSFNGRRLTVVARRVVLACGTLEIARLLLQPLIDGRDAPWSDNHWIGRGFTDHLDSVAGQVTILDRKAFHDLFDSLYLGKFRYYPKIRLSSAIQRREQLVDMSAQILFDSDVTGHLENIKMFLRSLSDGRVPDQLTAVPRHVFGVARIALPLVLRYLRSGRSFKPTSARARLALYSEQIPTSESVIRLGPARDAFGMRRVDVDWRIDGREIRSFARFGGCIKDALEARGLARVALDPALVSENPAFFGKVNDAIHQMSTARIGATAALGVVDSDLRVYRTDNLFVAGAAVYPTTGFANPTFTAIALGLRLCDHLSGP